MGDFGPKPKNQKTIEKPMKFYVFWVQKGDEAMRQNHRCRNKIVKNPLVFIVFSEIEAVKRLLVERVFIDQKSSLRGRICYKNQWFFNDFVFRRLIDGEDEKIRILRFARGFILKVDIRNDVRPKSFH